MSQKLNIGIVGAEEWTEEQQRKVRIEIEKAFNTHAKKKVAKDALTDLVHSNLALVSAHDVIGKMAEEIADDLGIIKKVHEANLQQAEDVNCCLGCKAHHDPILNLEKVVGPCTCPCHSTPKFFGRRVTLIGYKTSYRRIAETCNVLYCFVPKREVPFIHGNSFRVLEWFCDYCVESGHPTNNDCLALKEAKQLGKETHLIIIA